MAKTIGRAYTAVQDLLTGRSPAGFVGLDDIRVPAQTVLISSTLAIRGTEVVEALVPALED